MQLIKEQEIAEKEASNQAKMREEAKILAHEEESTRETAEHVVIDNASRINPTEVKQSLETVTEVEEQSITVEKPQNTETFGGNVVRTKLLECTYSRWNDEVHLQKDFYYM